MQITTSATPAASGKPDSAISLATSAAPSR